MRKKKVYVFCLLAFTLTLKFIYLTAEAFLHSGYFFRSPMWTEDYQLFLEFPGLQHQLGTAETSDIMDRKTIGFLDFLSGDSHCRTIHTYKPC